MNDWIDDESLSSEEKLARFESLNPEPTRGPADQRPIPGGGVLIERATSLAVVEAGLLQPLESSQGSSALQNAIKARGDLVNA